MGATPTSLVLRVGSLVAAVAVTVGVVAVTQVGASLSDRGPLGNDAARSDLREGRATPDPDLPAGRADDPRGVRRGRRRLPGRVRDRPATSGPDEAGGWRTVSFETGPDDDVDAVFAKRDRSIEIEVFCNRGEPTVGEVERNTLPD